MSETSAGGSGGAVAPGWYTDPHDPRQLRWWSGEGWTEHVSAGTPAPQAAAQAVVAEAAPATVPVQPGTDPSAPLPSRRALRDPATEASEAAEAALAGHAAEQQADQQAAAQAQAAQQAQEQAAQQAQAAAAQQADQQAQEQAAAAQAAAAQAAAAQTAAPQTAAPQSAYGAPQPVQAAQPDQQATYPAPVSASAPVDAAPLDSQTPLDSRTPLDSQTPLNSQTPSAPVPTLPVAPTSFLEQQGYAPMDGAAADPNGWGQPAQAPQTLPPVETAAPNAWNQPVQPTQAAEPVQPNAWNQPLDPAQGLEPVQPPLPAQPLEPVQALQQVQPLQPAQPVQPNAWNQPVQPTQAAEPTVPVAQGWGTPAAPATEPAPAAGMDSLFGGATADQVATQDAQANQWGLSPNDGDTRASRRGEETTQVAGSSSFWAWLIAISPLLAAGSIAYVLLTTKSTLTSWPFEAAVAIPYLLVLLFAIGDRAVLFQLGHTAPRSPAWAFATAPIYLIQRAAETRREDGSGTLLTIVWFASFIVAIAGIVGYGFITHHALISGLPT